MIRLIYRKKRPEFNSIENVFNALLPYLDVEKIELPFFSKGINNRIKNILYLNKKKGTINHITGNDHYLALGLKKRTVILTIHDIEILKRTTGIRRFILKKIWFDWPIKNSTIVTTISEFSKREILSLNNYKTPIKVIHNPITLPIKYTKKEFNEKCPSILHIGSKSNKNISRLIEALTGINCQLTIIGEFDKSIIQKLLISKIDYTIKTNLSNEEMVNEYLSCDLLSFISTYEGFGLPIIEAQAAGRVVITSKISSMPEIANGSALLVNPFSVNEMRIGILKLINDAKLRDELIYKGLQNIKRFNPETIAYHYKKIYENITNGK